MDTKQPIVPKRCVICNHLLINLGHYECLQCGKECQIDLATLPPTAGKEGQWVTFDAKSDCCKADIRFPDIQCTCSPECHERFVEKLEKEFGAFKKVTNSTTHISYKVPTRAIIEQGVTLADLERFPLWED